MDLSLVSSTGKIHDLSDLNDIAVEEEINQDFKKAHFVTDEIFDGDYPQEKDETLDEAEILHKNGESKLIDGCDETESGTRTSRRIRSAPKRYQGANASLVKRKRMHCPKNEDVNFRKNSILSESLDSKIFSNPSPNSESSSISSHTDSPLRAHERPAVASKGARKSYDFKQITINGGDESYKPVGTPFIEEFDTLLEDSPEVSQPVISLYELNRLDETKAEIQKRLGSFERIKENVFLCERRLNKESDGMECDCTLSKEDVARGRRGCGDDCLNKLLFIECGKNCTLGKRCSNKRFQNIENAPIEVFKTHHKGFGLRATKDIPKETFLMEYVGEVLDYRQFQKRARRYALDDAQHFYFMALSSDFFIDASAKGSISRFINHSCDPNAETQKWTVNGELRVGFFSKASISKGEEITFDYKYERYGQEAQRCFCGARSCRGWLGGEPDKENRKPAGIESDAEFSTDSDEDSESTFSKQHFPGFSSANKSSSALFKFKKLQRKKPLHRRKARKTFESREYEDVLNRLKISGIRTRAHTLELTRLMVRVTDLSPKITLAHLLREADSPCRRLFLDYHGLKILHGWMSCLGGSSEELDLKLEIEDTLAAIPIPNKTMLVDTKVWDAVTNWSELSSVQSSESSRAASPEFSSSHKAESFEDTFTKVPRSPVDLSNDLPESILPSVGQSEQESFSEMNHSVSRNHKLEGNEENDQKQAFDKNLLQDDSSTSKPHVGSREKVAIVREKAVRLLCQWSCLQEVFKIPRRELVKLRVEHEREVERAAANTFVTVNPQKYPGHYSYERRSAIISGDKPRSSRSGSPSRTRISRLDDPSGLLQTDNLSREDRRILFEQRAKLQQEEATRRAQLKDLHDFKCYLLKVDPAITAMFRGFPPVFFGQDHAQQLDPIEEEWDCPKMANLPCEAFREGEDQLLDPRSIYFGLPIGIDQRQSQHLDLQPAIDITQIPLPIVSVGNPTENIRVDTDDNSKLMLNQVPHHLTNGYSSGNQPEQESDLEVERHSISHLKDANTTPYLSPTKKSRHELLISLPKNWKTARDSLGRMFFFHLKTNERSWDPPMNEEKLQFNTLVERSETRLMELETLSTDSEGQDDDPEEDGLDSENEDDEDSDKEDSGDRNSKLISSGQNVTSDLSAHEKEYLLRLSRKKTKEERRMDRKNKKIKDPEKWEEEQLKRKERHVKHLRDGLIQEWIIPRMTDRDKLSLMSLKEQRERLANQKAIREQQNIEELEEMERDRQIEHEKRLKQEREDFHSKQVESVVETDSVRRTKNLFKKDASKVIVKLLLPYQRDDAIVGRIVSTEDFKHLAKKLTNYLLQKELRNCKRIEELKCSESVRKKSADFVRKYMSKFGEYYKRSPGP